MKTVFEQYTADAICQSMGLDGFVETGWTVPTLRLLLKPSFHPEVCVTLHGAPEASRLSVVALTERLWGQPSLRRLPELQEETTVPTPAFDRACESFAATLGACRKRDRAVYLDGMGVECCFVRDGELQQFAEHAFRPGVSRFVSELVRLAWEPCREPRVRNALAECASYVGAEYPRDPEPVAPLVSGLLVLGTPEARADFFELLPTDVSGKGPQQLGKTPRE